MCHNCGEDYSNDDGQLPEASEMTAEECKGELQGECEDQREAELKERILELEPAPPPARRRGKTGASKTAPKKGKASQKAIKLALEINRRKSNRSFEYFCRTFLKNLFFYEIAAFQSELMQEVAIDEWMGASPIYSKRMQRALRFNHSNYWRFDMSARHPYRFAFDDWAFDRHGFPKQP
ncbi:MAG: hypothetical protein IH805_08325 [Proteobacteria bacterium]|nr:hypothetical protein [Pseudomonadota bacterium]